MIRDAVEPCSRPEEAGFRLPAAGWLRVSSEASVHMAPNASTSQKKPMRREPARPPLQDASHPSEEPEPAPQDAACLVHSASGPATGAIERSAEAYRRGKAQNIFKVEKARHEPASRKGKGAKKGAS